MHRGRINKVIVSLISADGQKELFSRCPPTTSILDLKSSWKRQHGPETGDILLRTISGLFPTDDLTLNDIHDCSNPTQVVELFVLSGQGITVTSDGQSKTLSAYHMSKTPQQLEVTIRELFHLPSNQHFRLRSSGNLLAMDLPLMEQEVGPGSELQLEKRSFLALTDLWKDGKEVEVEVFESQTLSDALSKSWPQKVKITTTLDSSVSPDTLVREVLNTDDLVKLEIDCLRYIPLLVRHRLSRPALWAEDAPKTVIPGTGGPKEVMSRSLVPTARSFGRLPKCHPVDCQMYHVDPVRVLFHEGEKKTARFKILRLPQDGVSNDVRESLVATGRHSARDAQVVDGEGKGVEGRKGVLSSLKDGARVQLKAKEPAHCIRVVTGGKTLTWTEHRLVINFSELAGQVALLTKTSLLEAKRKAFRCSGCGRKVCLEEEEFQLIPASCCRLRSLKLLEVKDKCMQTRYPRYSDKQCGVDFRPQTLELPREPIISAEETRTVEVQAQGEDEERRKTSSESERGSTLRGPLPPIPPKPNFRPPRYAPPVPDRDPPRDRGPPVPDRDPPLSSAPSVPDRGPSRGRIPSVPDRDPPRSRGPSVPDRDPPRSRGPSVTDQDRRQPEATRRPDTLPSWRRPTYRPEGASLSPHAPHAGVNFPYDFVDDSSVEVLLRLPKGSKGSAKSSKTQFQRDDVLNRVIEKIHHDRPFFPVNDIIVNGRRLNTGDDWRKQTVSQCGIRSGDTVEIEVGRPDTVTVLTMHVDGFHDRENIPLDIDEWSWGSLWSRIENFFATGGKDPVVFISMTFIDRLGKPQQRGVRGGNLLHGMVANYDEETGHQITAEGSHEVAETFANEFLCADSGFRAPPQCSPILHIHPNCDVLCLPAETSNIKDVYVASEEVLFDVNSVALIWGLRAKKGRGDEWQLYLEYGDGSICNVEYGNSFEDPSSLPSSSGDVRRAVLVLKNENLVPHCRTTSSNPVKVWTRKKRNYSIQGRRIKVQKMEDKKIDALWILTKSVGVFQKNFTDIMGRN